MLNRVILMGRITQDLEVRQTPSGNAVLRFNVAVDRPVRHCLLYTSDAADEL